MAVSVGGVSVHRILGAVQPSGETVRLSTRPGVGGHDVHRLGVRGVSFTLPVWFDAATAAARKAKIEQLNGLRGTLVTVVDHDGQSYPNLLVQGTRVVRRQDLALAVGGLTDGTFVALVELELLNTTA